VVQLGAYKEAGNVKLLLSKLKGVGVPAYTEKYESAQGPRTRVRAGPFASQEAAEKARSRIRIIGVDGPVAPR
jgi:DedD protein